MARNGESSRLVKVCVPKLKKGVLPVYMAKLNAVDAPVMALDARSCSNGEKGCR